MYTGGGGDKGKGKGIRRGRRKRKEVTADDHLVQHPRPQVRLQLHPCSAAPGPLLHPLREEEEKVLVQSPSPEILFLAANNPPYIPAGPAATAKSKFN